MKELFKGYIPYTDAQFNEIWNNCLFIPDTNVLLDLYRYSETTRDGLITIFDKISDRLWLPHQVGLEFFDRRPDVIVEQMNYYDKALKLLTKLIDDAKSGIEDELRFKYHPVIDKKVFFESIQNHIEEIKNELSKQKEEHPNLLREDKIMEKILGMFDGKTGAPYGDKNKLEEIYKEGKQRYEQDIPPGYADADKEGNAKYNDLVIWNQCIDQACDSKQPIVFITRDLKEDWWKRPKGKTIGPRPELIAEMWEKAEVSFYMYVTDNFMKYAKQYLEIDIEQESINEVRDDRLETESRQQQQQTLYVPSQPSGASPATIIATPFMGLGTPSEASVIVESTASRDRNFEDRTQSPYSRSDSEASTMGYFLSPVRLPSSITGLYSDSENGPSRRAKRFHKDTNKDNDKETDKD